MSPDLGRFLQPDPIGFKGDASNLYRYCGNAWANRTDPTGLGGNYDPYSSGNPVWVDPQKNLSRNDRAFSERGSLMGQMINVQRINFRTQQDLMMGFTMGNGP